MYDTLNSHLRLVITATPILHTFLPIPLRVGFKMSRRLMSLTMLMMLYIKQGYQKFTITCNIPRTKWHKETSCYEDKTLITTRSKTESCPTFIQFAVLSNPIQQDKSKQLLDKL